MSIFSRQRQSGFTLIEITISISVMAILAALAVPALGNLLSRNYTRTAATFFQSDFRQARYEARSRPNDTIIFCAIGSSIRNNLANCSTTEAYEHGWLWYHIDSGGNQILLGKNYAVGKSDVTVTPLINFAIQMNKNNISLWNKDDASTRTEISIPYGTDPTYPSITFSDSSNRSSVVVFDETGRTSLKHN